MVLKIIYFEEISGIRAYSRDMKKKTPVISGLLSLSFIAFISLGLPDGLLGVAWPGIRQDFFLPLDALGSLLVFSTTGYILSSFFSGTFVRLLGLGGLLSISCFITASALLIYSFTPFWILFVLSSMLGGVGAGAIDAGINTYVAGNHSERMMQWLHASFGIGVTLGPLIMTFSIVHTGFWQRGYQTVAAAQLVLAVVFFTTRSWWKGRKYEDAVQETDPVSLTDTLKVPAAWLGMLIFLLYTGVELGTGLWSYTLLTESRGISPGTAGFVTGSYWGMFTLGRVLAGWYARKLSVGNLIYISIFLALAGVLLILCNIHNVLTVAGFVLTGLAIAPVFPGLVSDTGNRVGSEFEKHTIGMQIAAAGVGAAIIPSLAGVFARIFGLEVIPFFILTALILLLFFFRLSHGMKKNRQPVRESSLTD